jgi:glycosyltransferase involved in cell wall biosynthesis
MVGGMETFSAGVWRSVARTWPDGRLIANGGTQRNLPWWLPVAMARTAYLVARRKVDFVLVGDALAYTVMAPLLRLLRVPHATLVMGLDITWQYRAYRFVAHRALRRAPSVIAISSATAETAEVVARVAPERIHVVRLGVPVPDEEVDRAVARKELNRWLGLADDRAVLLTVGRLVRRKGARWFVEHVLPALPPDVVLLVAGDGVERAALEEAAARRDLGDRVRLLGRVSDDERELLFRGVDAFVQPNVHVPNDMEGFGLVTIEAAVRDALTLASGIEGIRDAVIDGETGVLLPAERPDAWVERLRALLADRAEMARLGAAYGRRARELYSEDAMAAGLAAILDRPEPRPGAAAPAPAAPTAGRRA